MKLTNGLIETMINGLLKPIVDRKKAIKAEIAGIVASEIADQYPPEVHRLVRQKSKYLKYSSCIRIRVQGAFSYVYPEEDVVVDDRSVYVIEGPNAQRLADLENEYKVLTQKYSKCDKELTATLKALGSDIRVRKEFPEAAEFLPTPSENLVPALNLEKIRLDLKTLI